MRLARAFALGGFALLMSGCYKMTIVNGRPPASAPVVDDRWRSATVVDIIDIDTPIRLELECKETGWAKIRQAKSPVDWLVDVFLAGVVYESTHVDVHCATGPAPAPGGKPADPPLPAGKPIDL